MITVETETPITSCVPVLRSGTVSASANGSNAKPGVGRVVMSTDSDTKYGQMTLAIDILAVAHMASHTGRPDARRQDVAPDTPRCKQVSQKFSKLRTSSFGEGI